MKRLTKDSLDVKEHTLRCIIKFQNIKDKKTKKNQITIRLTNNL